MARHDGDVLEVLLRCVVGVTKEWIVREVRSLV
jgi:hypothetical protein